MTFVRIILFLLIVTVIGACTSPVSQETSPQSTEVPSGGISDPGTLVGEADKSVPIVVFDSGIGNMSNPELMPSLLNADIFITDPSHFWGRSEYAEKLSLIRAANPKLKVLGFFRTKCVRTDWAELDHEQNAYNQELYQAARPYFSYTTRGDTLSDWPGVANFNFIDPAARQAMLAIFKKYQDYSGAPLDGVYWDYFGDSLWISPDVHNVVGEPDMDGDGIPHWSDSDELVAYRAASVAWIHEMRRIYGDEFIQIVNGSRALTDSTFAGLVDGMFYETFPNVGYGGFAKYRDAMDAQVYNNLWAAHNWPRTANGGPWLILSNVLTNVRFTDINGDLRTLDFGDLNRVVALLTDASYVYYDMTGQHHAGCPSVQLSLGEPTASTIIRGNFFSRTFENGYVELEMGTGGGPIPFSFIIIQNGELVQMLNYPIYFP